MRKAAPWGGPLSVPFDVVDAACPDFRRYPAAIAAKAAAGKAKAVGLHVVSHHFIIRYLKVKSVVKAFRVSAFHFIHEPAAHVRDVFIVYVRSHLP